MKIYFWISIGIVFYTFVGYGIVLYLLLLAKRVLRGRQKNNNVQDTMPTITLIVAAYNEQDCIENKIQNTLALSYPAERLKILFITDGSSDRTVELISGCAKIQLLHTNERRGKINAIHRAMKYVTTDVTVFTDANTLLNKNALINIARHYSDSQVGSVAGEKRIEMPEISDAAGGEGLYWKYESLLKKWDAELYTVVGAAGELFSIRTHLYEPVSPDTILDDFIISLKIAEKGYRIVYEPLAYAIENSSADMNEELKRKIRIAAGGIQSIIELKGLLNPFKHPILSFQYISHRVLRWTITPFLVLSTFLLNVTIVLNTSLVLYWILLLVQLVLYIFATVGWFFQRRQIKSKAFFVPYYFCLMNYAVIAGIIRFLFKGQTVAWEKARRK